MCVGAWVRGCVRAGERASVCVRACVRVSCCCLLGAGGGWVSALGEVGIEEISVQHRQRAHAQLAEHRRQLRTNDVALKPTQLPA